MTALLISVIVVALVLLMSSVRLVQQYERGVVLRFGRLLTTIRQPGLRLIVPIADHLRKVSMRTVVLGIPAQATITRDHVTVTVDAVVQFRVVDPIKAVINVQHYPSAVSQVAQISLRSIIGRTDLDTLLSQRDQINAELTAVIDASTEGPWGLHVERVEIKDIALPEGMKRSMFLQTMFDLAVKKNSTLVLPFPAELLRFFDRATATDTRAAAVSGPVLGAGVIPLPRSAPR